MSKKSVAARLLESVRESQYRDAGMDIENTHEELDEEMDISEVRAKAMIKIVVRNGKKIRLRRLTCPKRPGYIATVDSRRQCQYRLLSGADKVNRLRAARRNARSGAARQSRKVSTARRKALNLQRAKPKK